MSDPLELWTHGVAAFGYGGWAYVRTEGAELKGAAGGERGTAPLRMELTAVIEAVRSLAGQGAGLPLTIHSNSAAVVTGGRTLKALIEGGETPEEADLWAALAALLLPRPAPVAFVRTANPFVAAWADKGQLEGKTRGRFVSAIPKPNLKAFPRG
jgi:hypothetical protein